MDFLTIDPVKENFFCKNPYENRPKSEKLKFLIAESKDRHPLKITSVVQNNC
jgi:hypothetical protein